MTTDTKGRDLQEIGKNAYESLAEMVAALECDYDRLAELRDERADLLSEASDPTNLVEDEAKEALAEWIAENEAELNDLIAAAGECESREDAEERIRDDPLSLEVRSGWVTPGEDMTAEDFTILLCTGGPAVRIMGELDDHREPRRAWLEVQDWFTPWTQYFGADSDTLLTYARCFYFGE